MNKKSPLFKDSGVVYYCEDGVWVEGWYGESHSTGDGYNTDDTGSIDEASVDCYDSSSDCVGKPCNANRKNPVFRDSGIVYNCVDGVWVEDWEYNGSGGSWGDGYDTDDTGSPEETDVPGDLNVFSTGEICYALCTRQTLGGQKHTFNRLHGFNNTQPINGQIILPYNPNDPDLLIQACLNGCLWPLVFNDGSEGSSVDDEDSDTGSGTGSETGSEVTNPYSASEICDNSGCVGWPCDEDRIPIARHHEDSGYYVYSCVDGIWVDEFEYYDTTTAPTNDQTTTEPFVTTLTPVATTTSDFATTTMAPSACDEERTHECPDNSFCVPAGNFVTFTCQCKSSYFMSGNMCRKKSPEAESCPSDFKKDLFKMNLNGLKDPKYYLNRGSVMIQVESQVVSRFRSGLIFQIHLI